MPIASRMTTLKLAYAVSADIAVGAATVADEGVATVTPLVVNPEKLNVFGPLDPYVNACVPMYAVTVHVPPVKTMPAKPDAGPAKIMFPSAKSTVGAPDPS